MTYSSLATLAVGGSLPVTAIPELTSSAFRLAVTEGTEAGCRLAALFGQPRPQGDLQVFAVLADPLQGSVRLGATSLEGPFESITPQCPQAHLFERELAERWNIELVGHPWPKPVRYSGDHGRAGEGTRPGVADFFQVRGAGIHEVAVGPVHAGVIEPGHFRFQCLGEKVLHLEIALGYQHRGIERAVVGGPGRSTLKIMEVLAGDTTIGHATTYCQTVEALAASRVPARAQALRALALELERLANHTGDLGALAGDVGYLPTAAFCGRLRGELLNLTAVLCGNRFGRGFVRPGGTGFDLDSPEIAQLERALGDIEQHLRQAVELLFETPGVRARFEEVGVLEQGDCVALGLVGPVARAAGLRRDARFEFPTGIYRLAQMPLSTAGTGDVLARAQVRWLEIQRSLVYVRTALKALPTGPVQNPVSLGPLPDSIAVSCVEGWRGEIWHVAITDHVGRFASYKVVDPSFRNWTGLALALRGQAISDFPLCNKSFNLSYCGADL